MKMIGNENQDISENKDDDNSNVSLLKSQKIEEDSQFKVDSLPQLRIRNIQEEARNMTESEQAQELDQLDRGQAVIHEEDENAEKVQSREPKKV